MLIYYWSDGTWCYQNELEEYLGFMSDDFAMFRVYDDEYQDFESIEFIVQMRLK